MPPAMHSPRLYMHRAIHDPWRQHDIQNQFIFIFKMKNGTGSIYYRCNNHNYGQNNNKCKIKREHLWSRAAKCNDLHLICLDLCSTKCTILRIHRACLTFLLTVVLSFACGLDSHIFILKEDWIKDDHQLKEILGVKVSPRDLYGG